MSPCKFGDLGKAASDLLGKDFGVGKNTVELKTKAPDSVTFTTNGTHKFAGAADASVQAECKPLAGLLVKGKIDTAGVTSTTIESDGHAMKGLKLILSAGTPPLDKSGLLASASGGFEFSNPAVVALGNYDYLKGSASCSAVTAYLNSAGGVSLAYDVAKGALKGYSAKASYTMPTYALTGGCDADSKGKISYGCSLYHTLGPDMKVAAEVGIADSKASIAAVACWAIDKESTAKAKVDSCSMLGLSYKRKLGKATTLTVAGCFDLNLDGAKTKTGIALALAP
ncbi:putative outer mitochondrial membrane protein porin [Pavlovales sp. CCMP2436]|nr:putative outer mitochondrial membrane protein porin [Pavlovales sp. CCMP2436]|mmetsp:Transcript_48826/g.114344  ORF Transcript_48826/g.114344 Transcript_48826/m.114344 type:complete len:283 (-) Transcript_48826:205-1053(-)